jgi:hypothetical protein
MDSRNRPNALIAQSGAPIDASASPRSSTPDTTALISSRSEGTSATRSSTTTPTTIASPTASATAAATLRERPLARTVATIGASVAPRIREMRRDTVTLARR